MRYPLGLLILLAGFSFPVFGQDAGTPPSSASSAQERDTRVMLPEYFYKRLEGTIDGDFKIVMNLMRLGSRVAGDYYYERTGEPITFTYDSTIGSDGTVRLVEQGGRTAAGDGTGPTGEFRGRFTSPHEITGTWSKPGSSKSYQFVLVERYPQGSLPLDVVRLSASYGAGRGDARIEFIFPRPTTTGGSGQGGETTSSDALAAKIERALAGTYQATKRNPEEQNISSLIGDFISRYGALIDDPHFLGPALERWDDSFVSSVMLNEDGVLALQNEAFTYEGGAHPLTIYSYGNYETVPARLISLGDLFVPGYKRQLDALGETVLRKEYGVPSDETLADAGFFLNGPFELTDNFLITHGGLLFRFNQYEIGPYVLGSPEVFLPYSDIRELLRRGSLPASLVP